MNLSRFTSHDGKEVQLYVWDNVKNPKAVVKIAHGMAEHSARYDDFAKFRNSAVGNVRGGKGLFHAVGANVVDLFVTKLVDERQIGRNVSCRAAAAKYYFHTVSVCS